MTPDTIPTASGAGAVQRARLDELDARTLYELLRLRSDVFVVEQDCVFLDLDGRDLEPDAEQLWVADEAGVAAELRLLREQDDEWSVGRRYFSVESMALIGAPHREEVLPALLIAS